MTVGQIRLSKHIDRTRKIKMIKRTTLQSSHAEGSYSPQGWLKLMLTLYTLSLSWSLCTERRTIKKPIFYHTCAETTVSLNGNCNFLVHTISPLNENSINSGKILKIEKICLDKFRFVKEIIDFWQKWWRVKVQIPWYWLTLRKANSLSKIIIFHWWY